jgi:hypothetical protein
LQDPSALYVWIVGALGVGQEVAPHELSIEHFRAE